MLDFWDWFQQGLLQARRYALRDRAHEGWRSASALAGVEKVRYSNGLGFGPVLFRDYV